MASIAVSSRPERSELRQRRVPIRRGRGEVGPGLVEVAPGQRVVGEQLLVQGGDARRVPPRALGLAVGGDRLGEVGRRHDRERLPALDPGPGRDQDPRDRARDGRDHLGGPVAVEGHRAGGGDAGPVGLWRDLLHVNPRALRGVELDRADLARRRCGAVAGIAPARAAAARGHGGRDQHEGRAERGLIDHGCLRSRANPAEWRPRARAPRGYRWRPPARRCTGSPRRAGCAGRRAAPGPKSPRARS